MDFSKYIFRTNIDCFRSYMRDNAGDLPTFNSYYDLTHTPTGRKRAILSRSVKWAKNKGLESFGVTGLYLSPASIVSGLNLCKFAGECEKGCIAFTGNLGMFHQKTMADRTLALYHYTELYLIDLLKELYVISARAYSEGKQIYCRLNGTSDLMFFKVLNMDAIVSDFNGLAGFYDYTKYPIIDNPWESYHLTYSYSEKTKKLPSSFDRIAIVVSKETKQELCSRMPLVFTDGDEHDIRALDRTSVVLLQEKRATTSGRVVSDVFVQNIDDVLDISIEFVKALGEIC